MCICRSIHIWTVSKTIVHLDIDATSIVWGTIWQSLIAILNRLESSLLSQLKTLENVAHINCFQVKLLSTFLGVGSRSLRIVSIEWTPIELVTERNIQIWVPRYSSGSLILNIDHLLCLQIWIYIIQRLLVLVKYLIIVHGLDDVFLKTSLFASHSILVFSAWSYKILGTLRLSLLRADQILHSSSLSIILDLLPPSILWLILDYGKQLFTSLALDLFVTPHAGWRFLLYLVWFHNSICFWIVSAHVDTLVHFLGGPWSIGPLWRPQIRVYFISITLKLGQGLLGQFDCSFL